MKEKMLDYLNNNHWSNGRDHDVIEDFIKEFFDQYQPERSKREDLYCEFGCSSPVSFITSEGIKTMEPGKKYDEHLNEI